MRAYNPVYSREVEAAKLSVHGQLGLQSQPLFGHRTPQNKNRFSVLTLAFRLRL